MYFLNDFSIISSILVFNEFLGISTKLKEISNLPQLKTFQINKKTSMKKIQNEEFLRSCMVFKRRILKAYKKKMRFSSNYL